MRRSKVDLIVFVIVIVPTFCATTKKSTPAATTTTTAAAVDMIDVQLGTIGVHNLVPSVTSSTHTLFSSIFLFLRFLSSYFLPLLFCLKSSLSHSLPISRCRPFYLSIYLSFFFPSILFIQGGYHSRAHERNR